MLEGSLSIFGIQGLPEICEGDDLAKLVVDALLLRNTSLEDRDIVVITSKVVSKSEGRVIDLATIEPNAFAQRYAQAWDKDPRVVEVVLNESKRIVRQVGPVLITETNHGFVCANSGIDQSSSGAHDRVVLKGNVSRIPAVVVRGFSYQSDEEATMQDVLRDPQNDLFR